MSQGSAPRQADLFRDKTEFCAPLVRPNSIHALLALPGAPSRKRPLLCPTRAPVATDVEAPGGSSSSGLITYHGLRVI